MVTLCRFDRWTAPRIFTTARTVVVRRLVLERRRNVTTVDEAISELRIVDCMDRRHSELGDLLQHQRQMRFKGGNDDWLW